MNTEVIRGTEDLLARLQNLGIDQLQLRQPIRWCNAIEKGLFHKPYFIFGIHPDLRCGVCLPLALVKSSLFGRFLVSLPYINTGGPFLFQTQDGNSSAIEADERSPLLEGTIDKAVDLADSLDVKYLELRNEERISHPALHFERTDKVLMRLSLPNDSESLLRSFKSKLRSQVKSAGGKSLDVFFGGEELLDDFYSVFSRNMRDLGTPVFAKSFFRAILQSFSNGDFSSNAELCVVQREGLAIAGALLIHHQGRTEVPSASSNKMFNSLGANMWMYWNLLQRGIEKGSREFDFGRSSVDGGTYRFKEQWGAVPQMSIWQYYIRKGDPSRMRPEDPAKRKMIRVWQKLPLWIANRLGPWVVRGIP